MCYKNDNLIIDILTLNRISFSCYVLLMDWILNKFISFQHGVQLKSLEYLMVMSIAFSLLNEFFNPVFFWYFWWEKDKLLKSMVWRKCGLGLIMLEDGLQLTFFNVLLKLYWFKYIFRSFELNHESCWK